MNVDSKKKNTNKISSPVAACTVATGSYWRENSMKGYSREK
jgi:hypothetical protein